MNEKASIRYDGSKIVFCIFLILFFPIAALLFLLNARVCLENKTYFLKYTGSHFWVFFWTIFFVPIAILLVVLNGISLNQELKA